MWIDVAILAVLGGIFLLVSLKTPRFAIKSLIIGLPFFMTIQWVGGFSIPVKGWVTIVSVFAMTAVSIRYLADPVFRKRFHPHLLDATVLAFLLYGIIVMITTYFSVGLFTALNGFRTVFLPAISYFLVRVYAAHPYKTDELLGTFVKTATIVAILLFIEVVALNYFSWQWSSVESLTGRTGRWFLDSPSTLTFVFSNVFSPGTGVFHRPVGTLLHPHFTAYIIAMAAIIVSSVSLLGRSHSSFMTSRVVLVILILGVLASTSRAVIMSASIVGVGVMLITTRRSVVPSALISTVGLGSGTILLFWLTGAQDFYVLSLATGRDAFYASFVSKTFYDFTEADVLPLLFGNGFNIGWFEIWNLGLESQSPTGFRLTRISDQIHWLHFIDSIGLIGGAFFLAQIILGIRLGWKAAYRWNFGYYRGLYIGASSCLLLFLVSSVHLLPSNLVPLTLTYIMLGMIGAASEKVSKRYAEEANSRAMPALGLRVTGSV